MHRQLRLPPPDALLPRPLYTSAASASVHTALSKVAPDFAVLCFSARTSFVDRAVTSTTPRAHPAFFFKKKKIACVRLQTTPPSARSPAHSEVVAASPLDLRRAERPNLRLRARWKVIRRAQTWRTSLAGGQLHEKQSRVTHVQLQHKKGCQSEAQEERLALTIPQARRDWTSVRPCCQRKLT